MSEPTVQDLQNRLNSRFYGKYRGTVTDNDPTTMAVKASVPAVLGFQSSGWCSPCVPYAGPQLGFFMLPAIGSGVWIEFEGGDPSHPIWSGCYWTASDIPGSISATVQTLITTAGTVAFDGGGLSITVTGANGQTVVLDSSGITMTAGGGVVALGDSGVTVNNGAMMVTP